MFLAVLTALFLGAHAPERARAEEARPPASAWGELGGDLRRAIAGAELDGATVGVVFIDVETGEVIVEHNAEELLNPASNAKIVTAAAALSILGPEYRYETALYGTIVGNAIDGPLYLRGRGDPSLGLEDLWALAAELRRRNVRAVRGDIVVDGTYFESETEPPAFDQQPNERAYFRAPVGAVNVNRNVVYIHVRPSSGAGRPALVTAEPSGYLDLTNDTTTLEGGAPSIRISTRAADGGTAARVWGSLPLGHVGMRRRSRIDNPSLFAGAALQEALTSLGIRVRGRVREGAMSSSNRLLAQHRSDPLSAMIWEVGKNSDNFTAETLLITLGAQREQPGTWEAGREAVRGFMTSIGIDREAYRVVNGSGLFDANRYTPRQLATVLQAMWRDQTVRAEFIAQLATGGVDGTLSRRFTSAPALRNVRAKTGTLSDVTALSGYVLAPPGRHTLAFSILINGARGRLGRGRNLQDALVTAAAEHLHRVQ